MPARKITNRLRMFYRHSLRFP